MDYSIEKALKMKDDSEKHYLSSERSKYDASMMNGVEYLQKKLREKEKVISDLKRNTNINELDV